MSERPVTIGVDTSTYTTSVAAVDCTGAIVSDIRVRLPVPEGGLGLRQADAVFAHVRQMPTVLERLGADLADRPVAGLAVSDVPRPHPGSYLPVFRVGVLCAAALAVGTGRTPVTTSHQVGHLACIEGFGDEDCLGVHLSGGTTDLVLVRRHGHGISLERVGGGVDLHAGQFVDRVGRSMGLGFPAGPALDAQSRVDPTVTIPSAVSGSGISFSGPHSAALRLLDSGVDPALVAGAVLACIGRSVAKAVRDVLGRTGPLPVLVAGGVAASAAVREVLCDRFRRWRIDVPVAFAAPELCTDNAVGVARWGARPGPG